MGEGKVRSVLDGILEGDFLNGLIESEDLDNSSIQSTLLLLCHEDMRRGTPSLLDRSEDIFGPMSINIAESSC